MADTDRTILNHYNLTTLYPTSWPAEKDDSDASDEDVPTIPTTRARAKSMRRYTTLGKTTKASRTSVPGTQKRQDGVETMVQKDEPDPLGGSGSVVQRLRQRGLPVEEDTQLRNRFLLSSTSFSPSMYLSEVHNTASTEQLLLGLDVLSRSIEQKSASLKVLVESNFERFVRAKATIDNVYTEMCNHGIDLDATPKPHSRQSSHQLSHMRSPSGNLKQAQPQNPKRSFALIKESEYGILGVKSPLLEANVKAEEVWGPSLGGQAREEHLKSVLASIEHNRIVFETGTAIDDCIKRRDYESLADEYSRAQRYARDAKALGDRAKANQLELSDPQVHQIIITARIWMDIESKIGDFKRDTWRQLTSSHFGKQAEIPGSKGEEYMELIGLLMQLGTEDNPIWIWLLSRYEYLKNKIWASFERVRLELEVQRRRLKNGKRPSSKQLAKHLRTAAGTKRANEDENIDTPQVLEYWEKIFSSLNALLSTRNGLLGEVIEFWEIIQSFVDGNRQRSLPVGIDGRSRRHHRLDSENVKDLQKGAIDLFGSIREQVYGLFVEPPLDDVSALFSPGPPLTPKTSMTPMSAILSPSKASRFNFDPKDVPPPSPSTGEPWEKFAFWPPYSNSLSAATYLSKINNAIGIAAAEITTIRIAKQESKLVHQLRSLVGDIRERSITAICAAWLTDSENCRELEDWTRSSEKPDLTLMPSLFSAFEMSLLTNLQKIVYISDAANTAGSADVVLPPPSRHIETVQKGFKHSLYKAFSGMMEYAAKPTTANGDTTGDDGLAMPSLQDQPVRSGDKVGSIDASNINVRKILTISNFQALRNDVVPTLVSTFEANFLLTISDDSKVARDVLSQMNARVFQAYVRQPVESLNAVISAGIASPAYAPDESKTGNAARPDDARPYVYEVLLTLVLVHTEVSRTAPSLTGQVLSYLLEQLSTALIDSFKRRTKYTLSSLMQATLDVEFLAQTLGNYTTAKASEIQSEIYLALDERTDNEARQRLQNGLPEMRAILKRLRERTQGEFGCFKRTRSHGSREKK